MQIPSVPCIIDAMKRTFPEDFPKEKPDTDRSDLQIARSKELLGKISDKTISLFVIT